MQPTFPAICRRVERLASPDLLNPFRWSAVMDFGPGYRLAEIDTQGETVTMGETTYPKPGRSAAVLAAEGSKLGRVYMDWSPMPFVEVTETDSELAASGGDFFRGSEQGGELSRSSVPGRPIGGIRAKAVGGNGGTGRRKPGGTRDDRWSRGAVDLAPRQLAQKPAQY